MSERPATLQLLKKGKLICSAVFPLIVETWNWLVEAFDGLKGDYDVNPQDGYVTVDRTDPAHPVIRLARPIKAEAATPAPTGGGMSGAFAFVDGVVKDGGFMWGPYFHYAEGAALPSDDFTGWAFLVISGYVGGSSLANLTGSVVFNSSYISTNDSQVVMPLFYFEGGAVDTDYRGAPSFSYFA